MSKKSSSTRATHPASPRDTDLRARIRELEQQLSGAKVMCDAIVKRAQGEQKLVLDLNAALSRKVATYHAGLEPLDTLVSLCLNQAGPDDSFQRSLLLALAQGISELRDVNAQQQGQD